jgi:hypothetical protein
VAERNTDRKLGLQFKQINGMQAGLNRSDLPRNATEIGRNSQLSLAIFPFLVKAFQPCP